MDSKTAVNYSAVPEMVAYKKALSGSADHIISTRKIEIIPSSGGGDYGDGFNNDLTVYIQDPSEGSFLHPSSVYATCDIQTLNSAGAAVSSAIFESSANDIIQRVQVRGLKSRVQLVDAQNYNVWSSMIDKIKYPLAYKGEGEFGRGMGRKIDSISDTAAAVYNLNYGGASRNTTIKDELGAGSRRFKIDLSKVPLFNKVPGQKQELLLPLGVTGGFEMNLRFAPTAEAFAGWETNNTDGSIPATAVKYKVTNFRLHATVSYMSQNFMTMFKQSIAAGQMSIPFMSYIGLQHNPKSTNETVRIGSALEHLNSIFVTHRNTGDVSSVQKYSHSHFGNAEVTELQAISGGVSIPSQPLVCTTGAAGAVNTSGAAEEELMLALKNIGLDYKPGCYTEGQKDLTLATSNVGTTSKPLLSDVGGWNGASILGLPASSGSDPFSSVYNRSSSGVSTSRKADLNLNLKYASDPSAYTANFFLVHANVMTVLPNGQIIPEQLIF